QQKRAALRGPAPRLEGQGPQQASDTGRLNFVVNINVPPTALPSTAAPAVSVPEQPQNAARTDAAEKPQNAAKAARKDAAKTKTKRPAKVAKRPASAVLKRPASRGQ
ncbi:unnamed protein product, partial [Effrenium voratum]